MQVRPPQRFALFCGQHRPLSGRSQGVGMAPGYSEAYRGCQVQHRLEKQPNGGSMSTANKQISRRFTELFSTGDETLAGQILSPDVMFHGTAGDGELRGMDEMMRFLAAYRRAFPDARSTVEDQ